MINKLKELGRRVALHYRWHDTVLRALIQHNRHPDYITKQDMDQAFTDLNAITEANPLPKIMSVAIREYTLSLKPMIAPFGRVLILKCPQILD